MEIKTNFQTSKPLTVELNVKLLDYIPSLTIIDKIFDTKWKKQRRKEKEEQSRNNLNPVDFVYEYPTTKSEKCD